MPARNGFDWKRVLAQTPPPQADPRTGGEATGPPHVAQRTLLQPGSSRSIQNDFHIQNFDQMSDTDKRTAIMRILEHNRRQRDAISAERLKPSPIMRDRLKGIFGGGG